VNYLLVIVFKHLTKRAECFLNCFCKVGNQFNLCRTRPGTTIVYKTGCMGRSAVGVVKLTGSKLQYRVLANTFFEVGNLKILEFSMSGNCEHIIVVVSHF
jgi:hypothetical protein